MIEVRVGSIERHPVTGAPMMALEPLDTTTQTRLVLPLSAAGACSLSHELEGQVTLRGLAYTLLGQVAKILGGEVTAVEIMPAPNGMAAGRLRVDSHEGATLLPVEIALGISLAVVLGLPLRIDDQLVREASRLDQSPAVDVPPDAPALPKAVPDAFRRAFS